MTKTQGTKNVRYQYYGVYHNHLKLEPLPGYLYHPKDDPRLLQDTCPACKALMEHWNQKVKQMIEDRV